MSGQALAIVVVIAAGIATYLMSVSTLQALQNTRARCYDEYAFADVFASLVRAPRTLREQIEEMPGVNAADLRVIAAAQIDVPDFTDPVVGHLVSIPDAGQPLLNRIHLRQGRMIEPWRDDEILVSEAFASAHGLLPGDRLTAVIKGTRKRLTIVGVALSPEYIYQIAPGRILPDFKHIMTIVTNNSSANCQRVLLPILQLRFWWAKNRAFLKVPLGKMHNERLVPLDAKTLKIIKRLNKSV